GRHGGTGGRRYNTTTYRWRAKTAAVIVRLRRDNIVSPSAVVSARRSTLVLMSCSDILSHTETKCPPQSRRSRPDRTPTPLPPPPRGRWHGDCSSGVLSHGRSTRRLRGRKHHRPRGRTHRRPWRTWNQRTQGRHHAHRRAENYKGGKVYGMSYWH